MGTEGRVVVLAQPRIRQHRVRNVYAADFLELGLGATGATPDEALRRVMGMFVGAVQSRRKVGRLATWLNHSGLEWYWEDEYQRSSTIASADDKPGAETGMWCSLHLVA